MLVASEEHSIRLTLRRSVDREHEATERLVEGMRIFSHRDNYLFWLQAMRSTHLRFSDATDAVATRFNLQPISHLLLAALDEDISRLCSRLHVSEMSPYRPPSPSADVGIAYVLEGSGMGARLLERRAKHARIANRQYISLLSATSCERWPHFKTALEHTSLDMVEATAAARAVFAFLRKALEGRSCHA